ncbi:hypothetical protein COD21_23680 [Bacillus cereus]|uniref:hypothetical protein n=1 Tax=Bacillus cereus TaxID=1396 RepID=UPI000BFE247B|nr:hypothetical protein [Bacillus cereus]PGU07501.1 hypothetical protein COD21_23680 [Bacillus cereus]
MKNYDKKLLEDEMDPTNENDNESKVKAKAKNKNKNKNNNNLANQGGQAGLELTAAGGGQISGKAGTNVSQGGQIAKKGGQNANQMGQVAREDSENIIKRSEFEAGVADSEESADENISTPAEDEL